MINDLFISIFLSIVFTTFISWLFFHNQSIKKENELKNEWLKLNNEKEQIINNAKSTANNLLLETEKSIKEKNIAAETKLKEITDCINNYNNEYQKYIKIKSDIYDAQIKISNLNKKLNDLEEHYKKERERNIAKIKPIKNRLKHADHILYTYFLNTSELKVNHYFIQECIANLNTLSPTVEIPLKSESYQDLKIKIKTLKKEITKILGEYEKRYKTKANRSIYQLMVIALQAELQNILLNLKFTNFDKSISSITTISHKYINIAETGNQSINPTWLKFIGEIESLFKELVSVEYEFFIRQEQMKEEQALLKERMKQEAAEHRYLLEQEKKIKKEEEKYLQEIQNIKEKLQREVEQGTIIMLKNRISELESLLMNVKEKKEEIINLQNGKAGFVYIISNLGSFGENVFKIGMTRRLDPQDRIDELSNASVPFKFDVHSFIFSEDAVSLENTLHQRLDSQRVNKITTRKEFFRCNIDDLEKLVYEIQPSASFIKTMLAEQYRMTLQIEKENISNM